MGVAFHPTKNLLASCSLDNSVKLWNTDTGTELWTVSGEKQINSVAFSPDGSLIAAGDGGFGDEGTIRLYNAATGDPFGSPLNVGYAFSRFSTRISVRARPLFSRFSTRISV